MKNFLKKLGLTDTLTMELEIDKNEFVSILGGNVDRDHLNFFEMFSAGKNEYKGTVTSHGFDIKRKKRLFDMNMAFARATGTFVQKDARLIIDAEINAFQGQIKVMFIFSIVFYLIFITAFSFAGGIEGDVSRFFLPFIFIHALLMFGMFYFMMKRSVHKMKYELERDFYYMLKK